MFSEQPILRNMEIIFYFFCPNVYHTWYRLGHTLVYIGTLHIFTILSVCMPDNINRHQPKIIKFAHNLSYENGLNAQFINIDDKIKFLP